MKRCEHCGVTFEDRRRGGLPKKYCRKSCHAMAYQYRLRNGYGSKKLDEIVARERGEIK